MDKQTDYPISRCHQQTFQAGGIQMQNKLRTTISTITYMMDYYKPYFKDD